MHTYITIDGGTTNTRVSLVRENTVLGTVRIPLGARLSMDGGTALRTAIRDAIQSLIGTHGICREEIRRILASGMLTSEFGLCNLPHVKAPAGIRELHAAMHEAVLSDISEIPFVFIRGVKQCGESLSEFDMMRGEEAELYGLTDGTDGECLYVLPGSHSKLIECDREGRIARFSTMMTGEMLSALSSGTILRDAVDLSISECDEARLIEGYRYALQHGLSEAIFKTRVLKNHFGASKTEAYSFFLGAVLSPEINAICTSAQRRVVIGGRAQIRAATARLLREFSDKEITVLSDETVNASSTLGVIRIYEAD